VTEPVLDRVESVTIPGVGAMEAFVSDGLRTLLATAPGVPTMAEKTLRWPGHVAAIRPLLANGTFLEAFRAQCVVDPPADLVVLVVRAAWADGSRVESLMTDRYDPATGLTAMARTTAFTTSVAAQLAAAGGVRDTGVLPLERVARDGAAVEFILARLADRGVRVLTTSR
jgi:saccharopine dehydrogenase-like NADP-dependent oxidoreductase